MTYSSSRIILTSDSSVASFNIMPGIQYENYYVESFTIPAVYNNVPDTIVNFIDTASIPHQFVVPAGRYDIDTYMNYIAGVMGSLDTLAATFSVNIPAKFVWTITSNTLADFALFVENNIVQQRIGLSGTVLSVAGILESGKFNMGILFIAIESNIPSGSLSVSYKNAAMPNAAIDYNTPSGGSIMFIYPPNSSSPFNGNTLNPEHYNGQRVSTVNSTVANVLNSIDIRLRDELGFPIEIAPQRWALTLVFYTGRRDGI